MDIEEIATTISSEYDSILDDISLVNDGILDEFRRTFPFKDFHFYINIDEIDDETNHIRKYAVGMTTMQQAHENIIRFDNEDHHNEHRKVKAINPPHHKHIGKNEDVFGSTGEIDMILTEISKEISKIKER